MVPLESDTPPTPDQRPRASGWLWLLAGYLAVWQPITFAIVASQWLGALAVRGWPLGLLLAARLVSVAVGVAAVRSLVARHPAATTLARAALVLTLAVDLFVYGTSIAPNNRMPGDTVWYVAWTLLWNGAWLVYLALSRA